MELYTSYFSKYKSLCNKMPNVVGVSITRSSPKWWTGLKYNIVGPEYWFLSQYHQTHDQSEYIKNYNEYILSKLNPKTILSDLTSITNGKDCIMLCYEKTGDFCHRHLLSDWLMVNLNIVIHEI